MRAQGPVGKAIVAGVKDRSTDRAAARVVPDTTADTLIGMVSDHAVEGAPVLTDEASGCLPLLQMGFGHALESHSTGQCVDGIAHTTSMESFWSMLKCGYPGTCHQMPPDHLGLLRSRVFVPPQREAVRHYRPDVRDGWQHGRQKAALC